MPESIHLIYLIRITRGRVTLILRNLHWSQALLAIGGLFRVRIAPVAEAPGGDPVLELDSIQMRLHQMGVRKNTRKIPDGRLRIRG
jgi:hypothetical protein